MSVLRTEAPAATKQARLLYLDWLRVLAVLGVFYYHTLRPCDASSDWNVKNTDLSLVATFFVAILSQWGIPRVGARLPESLREPKQEPVLLLSRGRLEAWLDRSEPLCFSQGSIQVSLLTSEKEDTHPVRTHPAVPLIPRSKRF